MVALAVLFFIIALMVGLFVFAMRFFKALNAAGSARSFAEQYLAENGHESETNKAILGAALLCVWASFYLIQIAPYLGWAVFAVATYVCVKALCLCAVEQWALKEVNGEYEVDNAFRAA